jgi:hypothetical protein
MTPRQTNSQRSGRKAAHIPPFKTPVAKIQCKISRFKFWGMNIAYFY